MRTALSLLIGSALLAGCGSEPEQDAASNVAEAEPGNVAVTREPPAAPVASNRSAPPPAPAANTAATVAAPDESAQQAPGDARFACIDGSSVSVRFDRADNRAIVSRDGAVLATLDARETGSGFDYRSGNYVLRGKGDQITFSAPDQPPLACAKAR